MRRTSARLLIIVAAVLLLAGAAALALVERRDDGIGPRPEAQRPPLMLLTMAFFIMVQLQSFQKLFLVVSVAPLGLIGVVAALLLSGKPMGFVAILGVLALIGIIVRNSILLVDFVRHAPREAANGTGQRPLTEILIEAGSIRFKPILLTALAAMIGAAVILTDPIFQGLAISLLFGLASSTLLTVLVIPAIYRVFRT